MDREDVYSLTKLGRWSCADSTQLPPRDAIASIHVYDFDNTLFSSPLPNKQLWAGPSIGRLQTQEAFVEGGWWHDSSILAATGRGLAEEEPQAWAGHWNEHIVQLVELSMAQRDALTVLLTGRSESQFAGLIQRIVASRNLRFDLIVLKPASDAHGEKYSSTMDFKQAFLSTLVHTYDAATSLRIYEDRLKHTAAFRAFFEAFNSNLLTAQNQPNAANSSRKPFAADVIQVTEDVASLDPTVEIATVQRMINIHNAAIRSGTAAPSFRPLKLHRTVLFTAYLIAPEASTALRNLVKLPASMPKSTRSDINMLGNCVLITPRPADKHTLMRVGGLGHRVQWRVTGLACHENRIWAAKVTPLNPQEKVYTHSRPAHVILALKRGSKPADADRIQNWQSVSSDEAVTFDSTVGEKVQLRIDDDHKPGGSGYGGMSPIDKSRRDNGAGRVKSLGGSPPSKRIHMREQDFIPLGGNSRVPMDENSRPQPSAISANQGPRQNAGHRRRAGGGGAKGQTKQGGAHNRRDGPGGPGGVGRTGAQGIGYKSLDDVNGGRQMRGYADFDGGAQGGYGERPMDY